MDSRLLSAGEAGDVDNTPSPSGDTVRAHSPPSASGDTIRALSLPPVNHSRPTAAHASPPAPSTPLPQARLLDPPHAPPSLSAPPRKLSLEDLVIGQELRTELLALPSDERDRQVAMLASLQPLDRERLSNFARNRALMSSLGLSKNKISKVMATKMIGGDSHGGRAGTKVKGKGKAVATKRNTRGAQDNDDDDNESSGTETTNDSSTIDDDSDDSSNEAEENTTDASSGVALRKAGTSQSTTKAGRKIINRRTVKERNVPAWEASPKLSDPSAVAAATPSPAFIPEAPELDQSSWPGWMSEAYDFLSGYELNEDFTKAIHWWAAVERNHEFQTSVRLSHADSTSSELISPIVTRPSDHFAP